MATFNKFYDFSEQLLRGNHNFGSNIFKIMLTNISPNAGNSLKGDLTEISAGNGYVAGGQALTITITEVSGVATVNANQVVFTANGGSIGPFRYAVIYNDTASGKPLVGWLDYGQTTLQDTESITIRFNRTNPGAIFQTN